MLYPQSRAALAEDEGEPGETGMFEELAAGDLLLHKLVALGMRERFLQGGGWRLGAGCAAPPV